MIFRPKMEGLHAKIETLPPKMKTPDVGIHPSHGLTAPLEDPSEQSRLDLRKQSGTAQMLFRARATAAPLYIGLA